MSHTVRLGLAVCVVLLGWPVLFAAECLHAVARAIGRVAIHVAGGPEEP